MEVAGAWAKCDKCKQYQDDCLRFPVLSSMPTEAYEPHVQIGGLKVALATICSDCRETMQERQVISAGVN